MDNETQNSNKFKGEKNNDVPHLTENNASSSQEKYPHKDSFEIGGEDLLQKIEVKDKEYEIFEDIRIRIGTLLKADTLSILLGAGASVDCGGVLLGTIPIAVEQALLKKGITGKTMPKIRRWLMLFYLAARYCCANSSPVTRRAILERLNQMNRGDIEPLKANFEQVISQLHRWRFSLPEKGDRLKIYGSPNLDAKAEDINAAIENATNSLANACKLPTDNKNIGLTTYKTMVRKLLTRPLNLRRINVFTLNYDTLVEQAADAEGVVLLDGFVGTQRRVFRPESYDQDLYFPAETTEGRVHRFDRVLHLYKLHGSITWQASDPTIDNPYGVEFASFNINSSARLLIYPTPAKYGETLGLPYSELFRRFATAIVRPQSVLFAIGYGFGDEHVNAIIRQALAVPSFILVIVDPDPKSNFVQTLQKRPDHRVWIVKGPSIGTFEGFVNKILPDLQEDEIRKKVLATYRALVKNADAKGITYDGK
ncbi:MAG: SIR2 family protein [Candidatus Saccharicenans sp.]|nr:SIR2 family protein [Candidatus Saccharicenans sp.]